MTNQHAIYEIAAKEIAYVFDNPQFNQAVNEFLNTTRYQIDQRFNDPNTGFQAVGLISTLPNDHPVLVIRGTNEPIDDLANHDPQGIGWNQFAANRDVITAWLVKVAQATQQKPDIIGHSLGGAIAQIAATHLSHLTGEVVTFLRSCTSLNKELPKGGKCEKRGVRKLSFDDDGNHRQTRPRASVQSPLSHA
jgi:serralysin